MSASSPFLRRRSIYDAIPATMKRPLACVPFHWLAGRQYSRAYSTRRWLERADRQSVLRYQDRALGRLLRWTVREVPAYEELRGHVGRHPPRTALRFFPLLSKDDIQKDPDRFVARSRGRLNHYETTTGGTSGNQLRVLLDDGSQSTETGFMHRQWARVGYAPTHRKATFRGVEFAHTGSGRYWQHNPVYNELQFSPFHLSPSRLRAYWRALLSYGPTYLHGYPSAISLLAEGVRREGLPLTGLRLRAVLLGSEQLLPGQRALIQNAFRTRVYTWYGHSERAILAGECEHTTAYHSMPDYGVVELVDDSGATLGQSGDCGELVGTSLTGRIMPMIRYRTGDWARLLAWRCACGRAHDRFDQVRGRWAQEYVVGRTGAKISVAALNVHGGVFQKVVRYQYVQETRGELDLRVMADRDFTETDLRAIEDAYRRKVGEELTLNVEVVDDIPLTARGKLKRLVQHLAAGEHAAPQA